MKKVETQNLASHEEGVQFSRVIIYMINSAILASHEGKSIYSSAYDCLLECYGVDVRRKILHWCPKKKLTFICNGLIIRTNLSIKFVGGF